MAALGKQPHDAEFQHLEIVFTTGALPSICILTDGWCKNLTLDGPTPLRAQRGVVRCEPREAKTEQ